MDDVKVLFVVHIEYAVREDSGIEGLCQVGPNNPGLLQCINVVGRVTQDSMIGHSIRCWGVVGERDCVIMHQNH